MADMTPNTARSISFRDNGLIHMASAPRRVRVRPASALQGLVMADQEAASMTFDSEAYVVAAAYDSLGLEIVPGHVVEDHFRLVGAPDAEGWIEAEDSRDMKVVQVICVHEGAELRWRADALPAPEARQEDVPLTLSETDEDLDEDLDEDYEDDVDYASPAPRRGPAYLVRDAAGSISLLDSHQMVRLYPVRCTAQGEVLCSASASRETQMIELTRLAADDGDPRQAAARNHLAVIHEDIAWAREQGLISADEVYRLNMAAHAATNPDRQTDDQWAEVTQRVREEEYAGAGEEFDQRVERMMNGQDGFAARFRAFLGSAFGAESDMTAAEPQYHFLRLGTMGLSETIRAAGRQVFGDNFNVDMADVRMIGGYRAQTMANWVRENAEPVLIDLPRAENGDYRMTFEGMPGYEPTVKPFRRSGIDFLVVNDHRGEYVYAWPQQEPQRLRLPTFGFGGQ